MAEPSERDMREARALCGWFAAKANLAFALESDVRGVAIALASAREEGRRAGLERAALLPRKWKHAENVRQQIGEHVTDDSISDVAWIATVIEGDIRALIGGNE